MVDRSGGGAGNVGNYRLLHKYLNERFADRVVLTFGEIEDLLGFSLPAAARVERGWWWNGDGSAPRSAQSESWMSANRTAEVNLGAERVMFERLPPR